ncbi:MAG: AAA family ATPase [Candidatus Cryptobacteroides sp.]
MSKWLIKSSCPGLVIYGPCGTGKTTMVKALQQILEVGRKFDNVCYLNACQIVDYFRNEDTRDKYDKAKSVEVLLIDDLGCEPEHLMLFGTLYEPIKDILYKRYDRMLITVLTTNLGDEELYKRYGERIADRLKETFDTIVFNGVSYRGRL